MQSYRSSYQHLVKTTLCTALTAIMATGCAKFIPSKQMQARVIETTRSNITTTPKVSSFSQAVLLASGLTQDSCMADFDACLHDLQAAFFDDKIDRSSLVLMAELYYTQALYLADKDECKPVLARPPINEYYANAQPDDDTLKAQETSRQDCLDAYRDALYKTVAYSYGYLFFDDLTQQSTQQAIITDNDIRAQDLYHIAVNALIQEIYKQEQGAFAHATTKPENQLNETLGQLKISSLSLKDRHGKTHTLNMHISSDDEHLNHLHEDKQKALSELISIYDYRLADLQVNSTRSGLGVGFVGSLSSRHSTNNQDDKKAIENRIHPIGHLLMTAIIAPQGDTLSKVLNTTEFDVYFFNPYTTSEVSILGKHYPLSASFSSTYATWLSENNLNLQRMSLLNMVAKKDNATLPELFMLSPYNPRQKVIVMIHGLASSPRTWVNLTNNLLADPILRDNYQVWQIFYATNLPILENRYQIHELINHTFNMTDPSGTNPSSRNATLIGHSMGGVISRMLVSDDDLLPKLAHLHHNTPVNAEEVIIDTVQSAAQHEENIAPPKPVSTLSHEQSRAATKLLTQNYSEEMNNRFKLTALPQVDNAIFISAPFRGTDYADRWFTRAARRAITLPVNFTKNLSNTITNIGSKDNIENNLLNSLYLQNGADQLSDQSAFMALTADINIKDGVQYHTIVGDRLGLASDNGADVVADRLSDGIVPYSSSHLPNAHSETIITGRHNIHENPKTILQLRKILHEQLDTPQQAVHDFIQQDINSPPSPDDTQSIKPK